MDANVSTESNEVITTTNSKPGLIEAMIDDESMMFDVDEEEEVTTSRQGTSGTGNRSREIASDLRMSRVSEMYDRNHKGYLDSTEELLRRMDSKNQGFLDNNKVYDLMQSLQLEQKKSAVLIMSLQKEHRKAMSLKRGIIYMSVFALCLALCNIGTSFAAARLAKDTTTNGQVDLVDINTGERVGTTSKNAVVTMTPLQVDMSNGASRRLHERFMADAVMSCGSAFHIDYSTTDWETPSMTSNSTSEFCQVVGHVNNQDAQKLYQTLCPQYPFPDGTTDPSSCNLALSEVLMLCGTRRTRVLGGVSFPMGGVPGLGVSGSVR